MLDDPNEQYRIFTHAVNGTLMRVYLLNPGQVFQGFGGSRNGLVVKKTACLIVRTNEITGMQRDVEYDINKREAWDVIFSALSIAWQKADLKNRRRIEIAIREMIEEYCSIAKETSHHRS